MSSRVVSSLAVPLSAAVLSWGLFMAGLYTDLFVQDLFKDGEREGQEPAVAASTYLFFAAGGTLPPSAGNHLFHM